MKIPLSSPDIDEADIEAVVSVLRSSQLSLGSKLQEFEAAFAAYIGVAHGAALSSGTAGLHLSLQALGIGSGDEVIVPSFAFIAAANAIRHGGATPVFGDIDPITLNLSVESIRQVLTPKTRAIMLVHTFGYPADLDSILNMARQHDLFVIEDACEAIGAEYRGQKVGSFGDVGVFSFYPNKPMTTGEGGMLVTRNGELAQTVRALRNQGRRESDDWLRHSLLGYNFRLPEMSCALGLAQLRKITGTLAQREAVAGYYYEALQSCLSVRLPERTISGGRVSWFAFVIQVLPPATRDQVLEVLTASGISCRAYFPPIHLQPLYSGYADPQYPLHVTEEVASRTLALPFFNALTREDVRQVCDVLISSLQTKVKG